MGTRYSTADENHRSIRDDVNIFHACVLLLLSQDCSTNGHEERIVVHTPSYLVTE